LVGDIGKGLATLLLLLGFLLWVFVTLRILWRRLRSASSKTSRTRTTGGLAVSLELIGALVPSWIADEEIGDALEGLERELKTGSSAWQIRKMVATTIFWILVNSVRSLAGTPFTARARSRRSDRS
jgi:hypothetical protein